MLVTSKDIWLMSKPRVTTLELSRICLASAGANSLAERERGERVMSRKETLQVNEQSSSERRGRGGRGRERKSERERESQVKKRRAAND